MKVSKSYTLAEFLHWTRRRTYILLVLGIVPVALYQALDQKWIAAPWVVAAMLGTATSFILGFKNLQTYNRTQEALQVWTTIVSLSRYWGVITRDFTATPDTAKALIYRHIAWLTALRYHLRGSNTIWEGVTDGADAEYRARKYSVPETEVTLDAELQKYLPEAERTQLASTENKASRLISLQSEAIKGLLVRQEIAATYHVEMQKTLKDFVDQQSKVERIKHFPYPRQYATINTLFVWCFVVILPFCLVREFDQLNDGVSGILQGHMAWLSIPFSVLISWIYLSLDQVGESTENPFQGGANDVPMAQMCRAVEIELREILRETELPPLLEPKNHIIL
jgi:putative membrane protein